LRSLSFKFSSENLAERSQSLDEGVEDREVLDEEAEDCDKEPLEKETGIEKPTIEQNDVVLERPDWDRKESDFLNQASDLNQQEPGFKGQESDLKNQGSDLVKQRPELSNQGPDLKHQESNLSKQTPDFNKNKSVLANHSKRITSTLKQELPDTEDNVSEIPDQRTKQTDSFPDKKSESDLERYHTLPRSKSNAERYSSNPPVLKHSVSSLSLFDELNTEAESAKGSKKQKSFKKRILGGAKWSREGK
jgi:hypothetical protein